MNLRKKTLIIISVTIISLIAILYVASQTILLGGFAVLEEQDTHKNVERVQSALSAELSNLDAFVHDWAAWDDTYAFIQDANEDYVGSNLPDETFIDSELNLIAYINSSGGVVFGKVFDLENEEEIPVPESLLEHLSPNSLLLQHLDADSSVTGIILLPEDPILVASRPILTSESEGPILGALIMGYYLDSGRISSLAETTHLSLNLRRFEDSQMPSDFQMALSSLSEEAPIFIRPLDAESIAGYALLEDIYGAPSLVLRADMPRSIYNQGLASMSYFIWSLITVGVVFAIVTMLLLEKMVLSRLAKLSKSVNSIRSSGDPSGRVSITGKDELASLSDEINEMLETQEQSQNKLQSTNEKLSVVGKLTRHDARNKLSIVTTNVFLAKQQLTHDHEALKHLDEIESACGQVERVFEFARIYEMLGAEELVYMDVQRNLGEASKLFSDLDGVKVVGECHGLTVLADSLLRQLFYNLIDNSL
ncbi:MAG: CHASE4 domain-containing protein, partial [Candidatus Bathyarchaeota archaeon]